VITSKLNNNGRPPVRHPRRHRHDRQRLLPAGQQLRYQQAESEADEHLCGTWARGDAGRFDTGTTTDVSQGAVALNSLRTRQHVTYQGLQAAFDCGVLNINGSGWNAHWA